MPTDHLDLPHIRVLIADDHPLFRKGLQTTLNELDGVTVVGAVADGESAITQALELRPDVVLMDLGMRGIGGIAATAAIVAAGLGTAVLVLTMSDDPDALTAAIAAGARGYLLKGADEATISRALASIAAGEVVFGTSVGDRILDALTSRQRLTPPLPELTNRDREILDLVAQGLGNIAIARRLSLSDKTVRNQVSAILTKLGARDRAEAIARARAAGLGT
ncbi:MAG: response regulator transcription factor [Pseudonocardiales bacterium]|nr:response regulator transcription factor [Actinomycetota bacterium]